MKIFEKKKKEDGRREIYFCGFRVFKYKRTIKENSTLADIARQMGVKIGRNPRIINSPNWGSEPYFIEIGDNVLISFDVTFLTHDGCTHTCKQYCNDYIFKLGRIKIGNNCFIGCKSIIMPGITIGNDCVIGAGSVVTKSVPDGEVWAGNPAKFICKTIDLAHKLGKQSQLDENIQLYKTLRKIRYNEDL